VVTARLTAIDHIVPPVVIVHAALRDMQVQHAVEGFGDVHRLLLGLLVGVGEELVMKRLGEFFYIAQRFARTQIKR
jgi:hypothetical protein